MLAYRLVKQYLDDRDYDRKKNETVKNEEVKNEVKEKIPIGVYISLIVVLFVIIILLSLRSKRNWSKTKRRVLHSTTIQQNGKKIVLLDNDINDLINIIDNKN